MSKYSEVVEKAYKNHELIKLLSGDESYITDANGKLYLAEDPHKNGFDYEGTDPMNLEALLSGVETYYRSLDRGSGERKKLSNELLNSIVEMAKSGNAVSVYFAARFYLSICRRTEEYIYYPFKDLNKGIRKPLEEGLIRVKNELIESKQFAGINVDRGLWGILVLRNNDVSVESQLEILK